VTRKAVLLSAAASLIWGSSFLSSGWPSSTCAVGGGVWPDPALAGTSATYELMTAAVLGARAEPVALYDCQVRFG
jgi:hypothetical protein